jgi:hypothetical protein
MVGEELPVRPLVARERKKRVESAFRRTKTVRLKPDAT